MNGPVGRDTYGMLRGSLTCCCDNSALSHQASDNFHRITRMVAACGPFGGLFPCRVSHGCGYLRSVQQIREVVDRCPQRRKSSAHYGDGTAGCAPRPLVQAFHIPRRSRFYGGSGAYRPPRREMAGIPGVSRLTFLTLPRFSRVPGPCSYRFSLFSLWICHVLRGFCTRCCHVFPFCGCMRVHVGAYGGVRALIGACGRSRLSPRSPPRTPPRRLPCRRAARGWRRRPVGAAGRAGWGRPPPGGRR